MSVLIYIIVVTPFQGHHP